MTHTRWALVAGAGSLLLEAGCAPAPVADAGSDQVVVAVAARAGAVNGTSQNSDEFSWRLFTEFTAPAPDPDRVVFETWASDANTFSQTPRWPGPDEPRTLGRESVLGVFSSPSVDAVEAPCKLPRGAAVGRFPTGGTPTPCIIEEVRRNRPQFDYIVQNNLNTKAGLAVAFRNGLTVAMPTTAIAVKGDWVPVETMLQWIPQLVSLAEVRRFYHTTTSASVEYALVALHVSSRQNPNWVWGTFEHHLTPGRCDDLGCFDTFGAEIPAVRPNRSDVNTQYGSCAKTPALTALMRQANLAPVWEFYCLKSTQVDYTAADGTPYALGNSVIERIVGNGTVAASSCIGCHVYASFGANGAPTAAATAILPYNPTGRPIPAVLAGSLQFDFMWGVLLAP